MRKLFSIFCLIFFLGVSYHSMSQAFVVYDTIPIRHGTSKIRLSRDIERWFKKEKGQRLVAKNRKQLIFQGKGYFPYVNYVNLPDIYLSSHAAEKTRGSIVFNIEVRIEDSIIVTCFSNFLHEALFSEYGSASFGRLMNYEKVPSGKCMEVEEWCDAVWQDMKDWARYETKTRAKRMIPAALVRKRVYKAVEEKIEPPATAKAYDPTEYLKLENYLLKDTEGKYADYNKDPEEIAAAKAAAEAALAEKEKKKNKEVTELDEYDVGEEPAEEAPSAAEASKPAAAPAQEESYDEEEVETEVTEPVTETKKKEKPAKQKKEKKSNDDNEEEDDYGDE